MATDIDGTFVHGDYTYDVARFERLLARIQERRAEFVVASGNQYWQLRDLFPGHDADISFIAENGAYIVDHGEPVFTAHMTDEARMAAIDACLSDPAITTVMCGVNSGYCQRGNVTQ